MSVPDFPIIIAEWARNSREVVRVELSRFHGSDIVSIRSWFRNDAGELRPGKSGISLAVRHLPDLAKAFADALDRARELGLAVESKQPTSRSVVPRVRDQERGGADG